MGRYGININQTTDPHVYFHLRVVYETLLLIFLASKRFWNNPRKEDSSYSAIVVYNVARSVVISSGENKCCK